jgi:hypothetical protein
MFFLARVYLLICNFFYFTGKDNIKNIEIKIVENNIISEDISKDFKGQISLNNNIKNIKKDKNIDKVSEISVSNIFKKFKRQELMKKNNPENSMSNEDSMEEENSKKFKRQELMKKNKPKNSISNEDSIEKNTSKKVKRQELIRKKISRERSGIEDVCIQDEDSGGEASNRKLKKTETETNNRYKEDSVVKILNRFDNIKKKKIRKNQTLKNKDEWVLKKKIKKHVLKKNNIIPSKIDITEGNTIIRGNTFLDIKDNIQINSNSSLSKIYQENIKNNNINIKEKKTCWKFLQSLCKNSFNKRSKIKKDDGEKPEDISSVEIIKNLYNKIIYIQK